MPKAEAAHRGQCRAHLAIDAGGARAKCLRRAAQLLEEQMQTLLGLIVREAGKSLPNAIAEVREAVDFLRYYADQASREFGNDTHRPLGTVLCISPWNFPLAIFTGQVAAALAAGNTVLAKPAEQTPLIAAQAIEILRAAGVPAGAVQLLPGRGETVGAQLVASPGVRGVMFTGSTDVARIIARALADRLDDDGHTIPLIAETGGQNAMVVDSSALAEQVVFDVLSSAFDSAGQRCSALRVLCIQEDSADHVLTMLRGAMRELSVGNPDRLSVDVGPVIDAEARNGIVRHIDAMRTAGRRVDQLELNGECRHGTFVPPTIIEIGHISELKREIFGPVLHVVRYKREELDALLEAVNGTGYGLTFGVHTRIDETIARDGPGACRQRLRQPQHRRRGGGRAALRRRMPVRHRPQGRRPAVHVPSAGHAPGGPAAGAGSGRAAAAAHRAARSHGRDQHLSGRAARLRVLRGGQRGRRARKWAVARQTGNHAWFADTPAAQALLSGLDAEQQGQAGILADADVDHADFQAVLFEGWRRAARAEPAHRPARRSDPGRARTDFGRAGRGRGLCAGAPARRAFRQRQHGRCRRQRQPDDDRLR